MREQPEVPKEEEHYICEKSKLDMSTFFVCDLGNELSKAKPDTPVSFAEMQDAMIAMAKSDLILDKTDEAGYFKLKFTMESFLSKSGLPDSRQIFDDAFKIAAAHTKEAYPHSRPTKKIAKMHEESEE